MSVGMDQVWTTPGRVWPTPCQLWPTLDPTPPKPTFRSVAHIRQLSAETWPKLAALGPRRRRRGPAGDPHRALGHRRPRGQRARRGRHGVHGRAWESSRGSAPGARRQSASHDLHDHPSGDTVAGGGRSHWASRTMDGGMMNAHPRRPQPAVAHAGTPARTPHTSRDGSWGLEGTRAMTLAGPQLDTGTQPGHRPPAGHKPGHQRTQAGTPGPQPGHRRDTNWETSRATGPRPGPCWDTGAGTPAMLADFGQHWACSGPNSTNDD